MTNIEQARKEILKHQISEYLRASVRAHRPLCAVRAGLRQVTASYREFTVWGPDILDGQTLAVTVLGWEKPILLYAPKWCAWEQGKETPPAR